jgi:hypothetical protein
MSSFAVGKGLNSCVLPSPADAYNTMRLVYISSLDSTHRQQQQQHAKAVNSPGVLPAAADSVTSPTAGLPWLGLAGLSGLMQANTVQEEVRVRMTQVAQQLAELATQLVSDCGYAWGFGDSAYALCLSLCWVVSLFTTGDRVICSGGGLACPAFD